MSTIFLFFYFLLFLMLLRDKSRTKSHQTPRAENDRNSPKVSCFSFKIPLFGYTSVTFCLFFARGPLLSRQKSRSGVYLSHVFAIFRPRSMSGPCVVSASVRNQYSAPQKNSALPGTDCPASEREPEAMSSAIHAGAFLPRPTSMSEPTMARTMLRRNLFARILNTI